MSNLSATQVEDRVRQALYAKLRGEAPAPQATPVPPATADEMFGAIVIPEGKVEYATIVGESHPSGTKYYFTTYQSTDWDEDLQGLIPPIDPTHIFDHDYALSILMSIEYDKSTFAYGPPGSGKSVTPAQICARINYPFVFISGMGGTEPSDYVGSPWVSDGNMEWKDALASFAVRRGVFMLYDEPFKSSAQTNMCFQALLDSRRELKLYGHPDPVQGSLKAHPKFRMCLADNVRGIGDSMDKYAAEVQDQSTLNRTAYKVHVDYVAPKVEEEILSRLFPTANKDLLKKIVSLAGLIRTAWGKDEVAMPYSLRDTREMVEAANIHRDVGMAFKQTYYGYVTDDQERKALRDMWNMVFPTIKL